ncbi:AAA family ATPase [Kitasatospora sp. MBT66]|uniref:AAA family ATPase n=1 Tax=Kitasatospora sp. MBT66 TaxID=1444769 RepID=UPI0005B77E7A|nr:AAA family ATPase [Kitasatospora sp. MBT66]
MYSLTQSVDIRGAAGEPIPTPYKGLERLEVEFLRGTFSLGVAGPGTGKSLFALNLALYGNIPALYFSADSGAATQVSRATSIITGADSKEVKRRLLENDFGDYAEVLGERWWVRFVYEARPTLADLETTIAAYFEVFGCYPHLIVIDNITNIDVGGAESAESFTFGLEALCEYLAEMARETRSHVLALHHVTGEHSDGMNPIPLSGVKGKIGRVPSLILTIFKEIDGMDGRVLHVSVVKNREGFEDSSGNTFASFELNQSNLRLNDVTLAF